jgi:hypothetical protein
MISSLSVLRPQGFKYSTPISPDQPEGTPSTGNPGGATPAIVSPDQSLPRTSEARAQGNAQNWKNVAQHLTNAMNTLAQDATPQTLLAHLSSTQTAIDPRSAYHQDSASGDQASVSLETFLKHHDLPMPETRLDLLHLADAAHAHTLEQPLGNLGGALSWPLPLTPQQRHKVRVIVEAGVMRHSRHSEPGSVRPELTRGALGALIKASSLSDAELQDPAKALETLLKSTKAQAMGQAIQSGLEGIATPTSISDYVLAAINIGLDRESVESPARNSIAGFDLGQEKYWGMPPSAIVEGLTRHLVDKGRATQATAKLATHLLLSRIAPQLLVKDIPDTLVNGSQAWVNFCRAVAKVEASAPGTASQLNYGQVMSAAQALNDPPVPVITGLLLDWGVINGLVVKKDDAAYTPQEVESIRTAFNQQLTTRVKASQLLSAEIPSRKAIALAKLKEHFGEGIPFELKCLSTVSQGKAKQLDGKHSMLDMAMMGINVNWKTDDARVPIDAINQQPRLNVNGVFLDKHETAIKSLKEGIQTQVKHLISELPLEDRQNLEFGNIEFYQSNQYTIGRGFINPPTFQSRHNELLVRTEREVDGKPQVCVYEIDIRNKRIVKRTSEAAITRGDWRDANILTKVEKFTPKHLDSKGREEHQPPPPSLPPSSFASARTQYLADAFLEHLDINGKDQWLRTNGTTTLDEQKAGDERVNQFFLNLIPFRSAYVNFRDADYEAGLLDLGLDIFSLATLGHGVYAKAAKVFVSAVSPTIKALQAARILGRGLISAFNPLSGFRSMATGTASLVTRGARVLSDSGQLLINKVRGASGSYDLLKAANKEYGAAALGSFKVAEGNIDTIAIHHNGNWYAYDTVKQKPFGAPLQDFTPINGRLAGINDAKNPMTTHHEGFKQNLERAQQPHNLSDFNRGYAYGQVTSLRDYYPNISNNGLIELISKRNRTAEEIGILAKEIKLKSMEEAQYAAHLLNVDVKAPGVQLVPASQVHYLAHVDPASRGECAALANAMALAIERGKEDVLLTNLYRAASAPMTPTSQTFIKSLRSLQDVVGNKKSYHLDQPFKKWNVNDIIQELTNSPTSKTLRIGEKDHGLIAGIKIKDGITSWFFYDPNAGLVNFRTLQSMQEGLEKALSNGLSAAPRKPYGKKRDAIEYNVSEFHARDLASHKVDAPAVANLFSQQL